MNLLELVRELAAETGTVSPSQIEDVADPQDDHVRDLIRWIINAYHDIELERDDWRFRIKEGELELCAGEPETDASHQLKDFQKILPYRHPWAVRYITVDRDVFPVRFVPWSVWAGDYDVRVARTRAGRPIAFTMAPNENVLTYPKPNKDYILRFNYVSEAQMMAQVNTCAPRMPSRYHRVIIWRALVNYAESDEAQFKLQTADRRYRKMMRALFNDQLPEVRVVA